MNPFFSGFVSAGSGWARPGQQKRITNKNDDFREIHDFHCNLQCLVVFLPAQKKNVLEPIFYSVFLSAGLAWPRGSRGSGHRVSEILNMTKIVSKCCVIDYGKYLNTHHGTLG